MSQQAPADKPWSVYVRLSHCSGAENRANAMKHAGYILRPGECLLAESDEGPVKDRNEEKARWKAITEAELAKRVDARLQRLIVPLPNEADYRAFAGHFSKYFREKQLKGHAWLLSVHEGKHGEVFENLHVHTVFNDRDLLTGKKTRALQKKQWLEEVKKEYERWLHDNGYGNNVPVERVPVVKQRKSHAVYSLEKRERDESAALNEELESLQKQGRDITWDMVVAEGRIMRQAEASKKQAMRQRPEFPGAAKLTPDPSLRKNEEARREAAKKEAEATAWAELNQRAQEREEALRRAHGEKREFQDNDWGTGTTVDR